MMLPNLCCCSGIGAALCERLLHEDVGLHLCLACRNLEKANNTRNKLLSSFPNADISIVKIDVGNLKSVLHAATEIKKRYIVGGYFGWNACVFCEELFIPRI